MTNEANGLSNAVLALVAAFEAERKAFEIAYKVMEQRLCKLENDVNVLPASHNTLALRVSQLEANERADRIEDRIDALSTRLGWLDQRFEEQTAGGDVTANAAQQLDARMNEIELAAERLEERVSDLENKDDDDTIREALENLLDCARISISI